MAEKSNGEKGERARGKGNLTGCLSLLLVILVIASLFAFFGLGTERGKRVVQNWLGRCLSMDLTIGNASLAGPADLVIRDIESREADETGDPLFAADEMRIGFRFDGVCHISAHKAALTLVPGENGGWSPRAFSKLGELPGKHMGDLSKLTAEFRRRVTLSVTDSYISWAGESGLPSASVSGLSFEMKPVSFGKKEVYFYRLEAYNVLGAGNTNIHNVHREWLASDAADYVGVDKLGPQANVPAAGFWEIK